VGFVMLGHQSLNRAAQVARHWSDRGCPVVIHVDSRVGARDYGELAEAMAGRTNVRFSARFSCDWGTFGIVLATQAASEIMLAGFPEVRHVYLASGSCLPLRPVAELVAYLDERPRTDFIESVITEEVPWTVGGLDRERFTLRFPFSWKKHRRLFDRYVELQRRIGYSRIIPKGLEPHLGSQWWCLTRQTLSAILDDPEREKHDRYFRKVWIPDEAYFQTLARKWSTNIESRSLTLSKFDFQGKPHVFYDDHLQLLRRSDCFVARKIWPRAQRLYDTFLKDRPDERLAGEPNPLKIDRIFARAVELRTRGRAGLYMQSRFPNEGWENGKSRGAYSVFEGFTDLFEDFETWLEKRTGSRVHGHLFHKSRVEFAGGETVYNGCLSDSAKLRDYDPKHFLTSLIWNTQGEHQCFQFGPEDVQTAAGFIASDPNANLAIITGAWAIPLFHSNLNFSRIRKVAARHQRIEAGHLHLLRQPWVRARVRLWNLAEFIEEPMQNLQNLMDDLMPKTRRRLTEVPKMADLTGFGQFLQNLKNQGMNPHLVGDWPVGGQNKTGKPTAGKPYLVQ
jgi:hypothetical protein